MAVDTIEHFLVIARMSGDFIDQPGVTTHTIFLQDREIFWFDADWLLKILQGKAFGMPKTVFHFSQIFGDKFMGNVTIVAGSGGVMAALLPAIILIPHDMAVHAGFGVIG